MAEYMVTVKLSKAAPGYAWDAGVIVTDEELQAEGVTDVRLLESLGILKKQSKKVVKDEQVSTK